MDLTNVFKSLDILWKGMLAIFIVMAVVFLFVFIMNRLDSNSKKKKQNSKTE